MPAICERQYGQAWDEAVLRAEQDRINKPFRPVPMGLITVQGAVVRSRVWYAVLLAVGLDLQIAPYALLWAATNTWYNLGNSAKHWFLKNQVMLVTGCVAGFAPIWMIAQNNVWTEAATAWTAAVCMCVCVRGCGGDCSGTPPVTLLS